MSGTEQTKILKSALTHCVASSRSATRRLRRLPPAPERWGRRGLRNKNAAGLIKRAKRYIRPREYLGAMSRLDRGTTGLRQKRRPTEAALSDFVFPDVLTAVVTLK